MTVKTAQAAKSAACQPKVGGTKNADAPARCRLGTVCGGDAPARDLTIRRIRRDGAVMPTLCCPACAEGVEA